MPAGISGRQKSVSYTHLELIRSLGKKHTVILSSHILSEITSICDHVMIISHGKLVASDAPENLGHYMKNSDMMELQIHGSREARCV